jgi:hypothetical protein
MTRRFLADGCVPSTQALVMRTRKPTLSGAAYPQLYEILLLAEKTKSKEPDNSYNPAFSEASRKENHRDGQLYQRWVYREQVDWMSTLSIRGTKASERLAGAGISLIVVVGLIHLIDAPGDLQEAPYQGLLFLANFFGSLTAAIGIYRGRTWGWSLGFLVAGGALVGYVISRTVGLPGLPVEEEWLEPLGLLSLLVEALFLGLYLTIFVRPTKEASMD